MQKGFLNQNNEIDHIISKLFKKQVWGGNYYNLFDKNYDSLNNTIIEGVVVKIHCIKPNGYAFLKAPICFEKVRSLKIFNIFSHYNTCNYDKFINNNPVNTKLIVNLKKSNKKENYFEVVNFIDYYDTDKYLNFIKSKFPNTNIDSNELYDNLTGDFLDEPIILISNGVEQPPINYSTFKKCKHCPYTKIPISDIKIKYSSPFIDKVWLFKLFNYAEYMKIIEEQEQRIKEEKRILEDKMIKFLEKVADSFRDEDFRYELGMTERKFSLEKPGIEGFDNNELKLIIKILNRNEIKVKDKFLGFELTYDCIYIKPICNCDECMRRRMSMNTIVYQYSTN